MVTEGTPFQILAVSGGGYRGLHAAKVLADLEQKLGKSLCDHFDLLAGTSVGGLLILGLASGHSAEYLLTLLQRRGPDVFKKRWILGGYARARHANTNLKRVLDEVFGELLLGELSVPVIIPALDASTGKAVVLKTPHHQDFKYDHLWRVADVALATSAAPVYFPIFKNPSNERLFVDGGLVANAPGHFAFHEATHFFGIKPELVRVLSVGTASVGRNVRASGPWYAKAARMVPGMRTLIGADTFDKGILDWRTRLFDITISAQESVTDYMLRHVLAKENYAHIDSKIDVERAKDVAALDICTPAATSTLLSQASATAQQAVSDPLVLSFFQHARRPYHPFYGPKAPSVITTK